MEEVAEICLGDVDVRVQRPDKVVRRGPGPVEVRPVPLQQLHGPALQHLLRPHGRLGCPHGVAGGDEGVDVQLGAEARGAKGAQVGLEEPEAPVTLGVLRGGVREEGKNPCLALRVLPLSTDSGLPHARREGGAHVLADVLPVRHGSPGVVQEERRRGLRDLVEHAAPIRKPISLGQLVVVVAVCEAHEAVVRGHREAGLDHVLQVELRGVRVPGVAHDALHGAPVQEVRRGAPAGAGLPDAAGVLEVNGPVAPHRPLQLRGLPPGHQPGHVLLQGHPPAREEGHGVVLQNERHLLSRVVRLLDRDQVREQASQPLLGLGHLEDLLHGHVGVEEQLVAQRAVGAVYGLDPEDAGRELPQRRQEGGLLLAAHRDVIHRQVRHPRAVCRRRRVVRERLGVQRQVPELVALHLPVRLRHSALGRMALEALGLRGRGLQDLLHQPVIRNAVVGHGRVHRREEAVQVEGLRSQAIRPHAQAPRRPGREAPEQQPQEGGRRRGG
mmetsp:Transcript_130546/g.363790  ORF Transcript_130546/g.363790 Transcript_130546/m.363790 type:complete len:498 (-) Transcript_130546:72-1565(-)